MPSWHLSHIGEARHFPNLYEEVVLPKTTLHPERGWGHYSHSPTTYWALQDAWPIQKAHVSDLGRPTVPAREAELLTG